MGTCSGKLEPVFIQIGQEVLEALENMLKQDVKIALTVLDSYLNMNISPDDTKVLNSMKQNAVVKNLQVQN